MSWLQKILSSRTSVKPAIKKGIPDGLWVKCPSCSATLYSAELERNLQVCPRCNHHLRISGRKRLDIFLDEENREEIATDIEPKDWLNFKDSKKYKARIATAQKETNELAAMVTMKGYVDGIPIVAAAFDFSFIGGSLGSAEGAKFVAAVDIAIEHHIPFVCFSASGGARMQEGLVSLLQMAKTSAALAKLATHNIPYLSVLTDPTTGGVSASLATLGDIIIAEPNALIGFTGRRVIEQTVRQQLPDNFQKSEFLLEHGAIDMIIHRKDMRKKIANILAKITNYSLAND